MSELAKTSQHRRQSYVVLAVLLIVLAGSAATFVGYRLGLNRAYSAGQAAWSYEPLRPVVYEVGDLLEPDGNGQPDSDSLIEAINSIRIELWQVAGGPGTVADIGAGQFIISQVDAMHETIQNVFQLLRNGRRQSKSAEVK